MKTFTFSNGEVRLESQMREDKDFRTNCILWGCFNEETGEPLPFVTHETTKEELIEEKKRLERNIEEYEDICEKNERISRGNERVANATNINEFLNAYL